MKKVTDASYIILGDKKLELPISKANAGFFIQILTKIDDQLSAMLSHHCKVLTFRIDLHLYEQTNDNQIMSLFIRRLRHRLQKSFGLNRIGYVWGRERLKSKQQHYHLVIMVDGNKRQQSGAIIELAKQYWDELDIGIISIPRNCYTMIKRGDDDAYQRAFDRACYVAKVYSKSPSQRSTNANDYEGSRVKHKEKS